jgi:autonomous glycyl radical cofactor GrcA
MRRIFVGRRFETRFEQVKELLQQLWHDDEQGQEIVGVVTTAVTGEPKANTSTVLGLIGKIWYHAHKLEEEPLLECISELLNVLGIIAGGEVHRLLDVIRKRLVLQLASMYFKPKLEPKLQKLQITWVDALPVLKEEIKSVEKLQEAKKNPDPFLREVVKLSVKKLLQQMWSDDKRGQEIVRMVTGAVTGDTHMLVNTSTILTLTDEDQARSDMNTTHTACKRRSAILELVGKIWYHAHRLEEGPLLDCISELLDVLRIRKDDAAKLSYVIKKRLVLQLASMYFKPKLEPKLQKLQIKWVDALPVLKEEIKSVEKLKELMENPDRFDRFLHEVVEVSGPAVRTQAIEDLQSKLEPRLWEHKLKWADLLPVLETIDSSVEELKAALNDPMALLEELAKAGEPLDTVGKKLAIMYFKPKIEPRLQKHDLEWTGVLLVLEKIDSAERLQEAIVDPEQFLRQVVNMSGPAAKKQEIEDLLQPKFEPAPQEHKQARQDLLPVLETIDSSVEELKLASMHLKPKLEPKLQKHEVEWTGGVPVPEETDSVEKLQEAIADPEQFLPQVNMSGPAAKKQAVEDTPRESKPEPTPREHKLRWPDLQPVLETIDSSGAEADTEGKVSKRGSFEKLKEALILLEKLANMNDPTVAIMLGKKLQEQIDLVEKLQEAIKNPDRFLCEVAKVSGPATATKKLTIEELKLRLEPKLQEHKLESTEVLPVLKTIDPSSDELHALGDAPSRWNFSNSGHTSCLHDDQKQNPDTRSEEKSEGGGTYAPNGGAFSNSTGTDDGPRWMPLPKKLFSPSGREQLQI